MKERMSVFDGLTHEFALSSNCLDNGNHENYTILRYPGRSKIGTAKLNIVFD